MFRSPVPLVLAFVAVALAVAPAVHAKGPDQRTVRLAGVCTQQSTSKLKLGREDRGIEVEFEVDQNRAGVPWRVVLRRNGRVVSSLTAVTRAPSGSFEIRRVIAGRLDTTRITAVARTSSGETCTAGRGVRTKAPATTSAPPLAPNDAQDAGDDNGQDPPGHDAGDDNGQDPAGHDAGDDNGQDPPGHDAGDDNGGHGGGHR